MKAQRMKNILIKSQGSLSIECKFKVIDDLHSRIQSTLYFLCLEKTAY